MKTCRNCGIKFNQHNLMKHPTADYDCCGWPCLEASKDPNATGEFDTETDMQFHRRQIGLLHDLLDREGGA